MLSGPSEQLVALQVLSNHVVGSELSAAAVTEAIEASAPNPAEVTTLSNNTLEASLLTEDILVGVQGTEISAMVMVTDVFTCAGVVHVIDEVLVPSLEAADPTTADEAPATTEGTPVDTATDRSANLASDTSASPDAGASTPSSAADARVSFSGALAMGAIAVLAVAF